MAISFGVNMPASNIAQQRLENDRQRSGIKTWSTLFGNTNQMYQAQKDNLNTAYGEAVRQAYTQSLSQQSQISGLNLNQGALNSLQQGINNDLMSAYQQYLSGKTNAENELLQNYSSQVSALNQDLLADAEMQSKYLQAVEKYRKYLNETTYMVNNENNPIGADEFGNTLYEQVETNLLREKGLNYLYKFKDGVDQNTVNYLNAIGLGDTLYDYDNMLTLNELAGVLYDENGNLTEKGKEYYRYFTNLPGDSKAGTKGFDEYLAEIDPELREWSISADPYNYNFKGTKAGSVMQLTGNDSLDNYDTDHFADTKKAIADQNTLKSVAKVTADGAKLGTNMNKDWSRARSRVSQINKGDNTNHNTNNGLMAIDDVKTGITSTQTQIKDEWKDIEQIKNIDAQFWGKYGAEVEAAYKAVEGFKYNDKVKVETWNDTSTGMFIDSTRAKKVRYERNMQAKANYEEYDRLLQNYQNALKKFNKEYQNYVGNLPEIDPNANTRTGF